MGHLFSGIFQPSMFSQSFMMNALISSTIVAIVTALVGFFVVLRGSAFIAHALPKIGFAGAAGAVLLGISPMIGLVTFAIGGAVSIGWLGKRGQHDVVTALTLVVALGTGALFLVLTNTYATGAYALLFGQLVGVSSRQVIDTMVLGIICLLVLFLLYRPLLFASISKSVAEARGIPIRWVEITFLIVAGIATAVTVPVVGALLSFSLMIGPAATTSYLTHHPLKALGVSVCISVFTVWVSLILGYDTGWPIGFFVATVSVMLYAAARLRAGLRLTNTRRTEHPPTTPS